MVAATEERRWFPARRHVSATDAEVIGGALDVIVERDGYVTPHTVVDEARPATAPLHKFFEWNDRIGAEAYRILQAKDLCRSVEIRIIKPSSGEEQAVRQLVSVKLVDNSGYDDEDEDEDEDDAPTRRPRRGYMKIEHVGRTPALHADLVASALAELRQWSAKYRVYRSLPEFFQLEPVHGVVEQVLAAK